MVVYGRETLIHTWWKAGETIYYNPSSHTGAARRRPGPAAGCDPTRRSSSFPGPFVHSLRSRAVYEDDPWTRKYASARRCSNCVKRPFGQILDETVARIPDKEAIVYADRNYRQTWREFADTVDLFAV